MRAVLYKTNYQPTQLRTERDNALSPEPCAGLVTTDPATPITLTHTQKETRKEDNLFNFYTLMTDTFFPGVK